MKFAALNDAMAALLPQRCVFCELAGPPICPGCRNDLPRQGAACARCAEPLPAAVPAGTPCARCQARPPPWTSCIAALPYEWPVDAALRALKFSRRLPFAVAFGELLAAVRREQLADVDSLCPVPLHRWRHLRRGFNQAEELCRPIARDSGLPVFHGVRRVRHTPPQRGLDRRARRRNLRNAFRLTQALAGSYPLIVDDVLTTGETCWQLALELQRHGAERIAVLVVARAASQPGASGANV